MIGGIGFLAALVILRPRKPPPHAVAPSTPVPVPQAVNTPVIVDEAPLTNRLEKSLGSLQTLLSLNVVVVGILYLQEWLNRNGLLSTFGLHPEDVGLSFQHLLVRAGIRLVSISVAVVPPR